MPPELAQWIVPLIVIFGTLSPAVVVGLMLYLHRLTRDDTRRLDDRMARLDDRVAHLDDRVARLDGRVAHLDDRVAHLDDRVARLEHSQAKLEGLLEGLREAITRRNVA